MFASLGRNGRPEKITEMEQLTHKYYREHNKQQLSDQVNKCLVQPNHASGD